MAIAHQNTVEAQANGTSLTFAKSNSGSDLYLKVVVTTNEVTAESPSGVTYSGAAMTKVDEVDNGICNVTVWEKINPATSGNVVVSSSSSQNIGAVASSYTGVHQTTARGTPAKASGTGSPTVNVGSVASDELVVDGAGIADTTLTVHASQTERGNVMQGSNLTAAASDEAGTGTITMSWTAGASNQHGIIAYALKPAAGGGGAPILKMMNSYRQRRN